MIALLLPLIGIFSLTLLNSIISKLGRYTTRDILKGKALFKSIPFRWEYFYFNIGLSKHLLILATLLIFIFNPYRTILIILALAVVDFMMRLVGFIWPKFLLTPTFYISYCFMLPFFPMTYLFSKTLNIFPQHREPPTQIIREKVVEMIHEAGLNHLLDNTTQKLLASLIAFREKVAREIMVPRVNIFAINAGDSLRSTSALFLHENYSRIPVYRESLDNIIGVLMYKDVLHLILQNEHSLDLPIEQFIKPVLYSPENKKISQLFQEFRSKHIHISIIVNEYGGTEGIVTIEDILEEIVGEIEDEYDIDAEKQFREVEKGNYLVDAKMSISDMESRLGIKIPAHPEYETIGGFVFHKAGTIPLNGWSIHHDDFQIEVLASNNRSVEKVRIIKK